nr:IS91 family transposase [Bacteroidota bacterium]
MLKNKVTIADVIREFGDDLQQTKKVTSYQKRIFTTLKKCRTPALGGHVEVCRKCGFVHTGWNSCRNRHCPTCNSIKRERWILERRSEMLPVDYFHMVFTLPDSLNNLCLHHPKLLYGLLFKCVWSTMQKFAGSHKHLGAKSGMIAVLHTWGQNLQLHPHLHCLVPGGGLTQQNKWRSSKAKGKYLFPVKALSKVFRGKFTDELIKLSLNGEIHLDVPFIKNKKYRHPFYKRKWVVFAKRPVLAGEKTLEYLGRYVHKVAIGNSRIKSIDKKNITFSWFDYKTSKGREMTLTGVEFLRRWSMHILPEGFVKVRHYGICSNRNKMMVRQIVYECLDKIPPSVQKGLKWYLVYEQTYGKSPFLCPACEQDEMVKVQLLPPVRDGPIKLRRPNTK